MVRDGHDLDSIWEIAEQDGEGVAVENLPTDLAAEFRSGLGRGCDPSNATFDLVDEARGGRLAAEAVPFESLPQFERSVGMVVSLLGRH